MSLGAKPQRTVTVQTHYTPPWSFGDCSGAEIDTIRLAFAHSGIQIKCSQNSYERLVWKVVHGEYEFASPVVSSVGKKGETHLSSPYVSYVDVVVSFADGKGEKENFTLKDLKGKKIVAYQNAKEYLGDDFNEAVKSALSYKELPERDGQIKMLGAGRVDYVVGEKHILKYIAKKYFPDKKLVVHKAIKKWSIGGGSKDLELIKLFDEGLEKVKESGKFKEVLIKYGIQTTP